MSLAQALLLSQAGPFAGRLHHGAHKPGTAYAQPPIAHCPVATISPTTPPLTRHRCACGGVLNDVGDHRAACATTDVLAARAPTMERALARICHEAGPRGARNVALSPMNVEVACSDGRRVEVAANGFLAYHGQHLAIDAACVSPITRAGNSHPATSTTHGRAAQQTETRKRCRYWRPVATSSLRWPSEWAGGGEPKPANCFVPCAGTVIGSPSVPPPALAGQPAGLPCWPSPSKGHWLSAYWNYRPQPTPWMVAPDLPDLLADVRWDMPALPSRTLALPSAGSYGPRRFALGPGQNG